MTLELCLVILSSLWFTRQYLVMPRIAVSIITSSHSIPSPIAGLLRVREHGGSELTMVLKKALRSALGGGIPGALAMVLQVCVGVKERVDGRQLTLSLARCAGRSSC